MATKAGLLATINGFITAIITQAKHRSSMSSVVDEIYPISITDNHTSQTYTNKIDSRLQYEIMIIKSGNIAHISGTVTNNSPGWVRGAYVFTFKENQFKPKSGLNDLTFQVFGDENNIELNISNFGLFVNTNYALYGYKSYIFDFKTYITQD